MSDIIIKPLVTEKATRSQERSGNKQYIFEVKEDANKIEIKKAIEARYLVQVASVRTVIMAPRVRRRYTKAGIIAGKTSRIKKAYITLASAQEINFFNN